MSGNDPIEINDIKYGFGEPIIFNHVIKKGDSQTMLMTISYLDGSTQADGPFYVYIGDIGFNFSTVASSGDLITFTAGGVEYQAEEGMRWLDWVNTSYNVDGFTAEVGNYAFGPEKNLMYGGSYVDAEEYVIDGASYTFSNRRVPKPH